MFLYIKSDLYIELHCLYVRKAIELNYIVYMYERQ